MSRTLGSGNTIAGAGYRVVGLAIHEVHRSEQVCIYRQVN